MSTNNTSHIKKKIAIVVSDIRITGGLRTFVKFLVDNISKNNNYEVTIFSLASSRVDNLSSRLLNPMTWFSHPKINKINFFGYDCFHVGANFVELEWQRYFKRNILSQILRDFDIIQLVAGAPAIAFSVLNLDVPVVLQVATRTVTERKSIFSNIISVPNIFRLIVTHIINILDIYCIKKVDYIMVENDWMYKYCFKLRNNNSKNLLLAPPGVNTKLYTPLLNRSANTTPGYILSVGRFSDPRKNINFLLHCYINVFKKFKNPPKLILAGSTPPDISFWALVSDNSIEGYVEYISNPTEIELVCLYQNASCFALTSNEEGFGIVLIEAMSCGIPVISTKCGGPEMIITDSVDGYLTDIGDSLTFSNHLYNLCSNAVLNRKIGESARLKVIKHYDSYNAVKVFIDIYNKLLLV